MTSVNERSLPAAVMKSLVRRHTVGTSYIQNIGLFYSAPTRLAWALSSITFCLTTGKADPCLHFLLLEHKNNNAVPLFSGFLWPTISKGSDVTAESCCFVAFTSFYKRARGDEAFYCFNF